MLGHDGLLALGAVQAQLATPVGTDHIDRVLLQIAEEILRLLTREVGLLECALQRLGCEKTFLLPLRDDALQLLDLHDGCRRGGHQNLKLVAQLDSPGTCDSHRDDDAASTSPHLR